MYKIIFRTILKLYFKISQTRILSETFDSCNDESNWRYKM